MCVEIVRHPMTHVQPPLVGEGRNLCRVLCSRCFYFLSWLLVFNKCMILLILLCSLEMLRKLSSVPSDYVYSA